MPTSKSKKKKRKKTAHGPKPKPKRQGLPSDVELRINPPGKEKMSEALIRFAEPLARYAVTEEDYKKLYSVSVLAWNAALFPSEGRSEVNDLIDNYIPEDEDDVKLIINGLIHRKQLFFAEYSRMIVHYEVTMTGNDVQVSVASIDL